MVGGGMSWKALGMGLILIGASMAMLSPAIAKKTLPQEYGGACYINGEFYGKAEGVIAGNLNKGDIYKFSNGLYATTPTLHYEVVLIGWPTLPSGPFIGWMQCMWPEPGDKETFEGQWIKKIGPAGVIMSGWWEGKWVYIDAVFINQPFVDGKIS